MYVVLEPKKVVPGQKNPVAPFKLMVGIVSGKAKACSRTELGSCASANLLGRAVAESRDLHCLQSDTP